MPYMIDGQQTEVGAEPQLQNGVMWVPLRSTAQALGANVDWEPTNGVAILYMGDHMVTAQIGQSSVDVDGQSLTLQAAPYVADGEAWAPARLFEMLGYNVSADVDNNTISISTGNQ